MDAFELIREHAARLHFEQVAAGADPFAPSALIDAALKQKGIKS